MFNSKGLFSETACPYRQQCLIPRCIFSHQDAQTSTSLAVANPEEIELQEDDQSGQRKRRKLKDEDQKLKPEDSQLAKLPQPPKVNLGSDEKVPKRISALTREISPPPLRRKAQNGTSVPVEQSTTRNGTISSAPTTPNTVVKISAKTPIKKEGLNPRSLKGPPPATHDMRFRLLRALHEHFERLNTELAKDANDVEEELVLSEQALITKALDIEEDAAGTPSIYSNMVKNKIMIYKRMNVEQWVEERSKEAAKIKAIEAASLSDMPLSKPTEPPKLIDTGLSPDEELNLLYRLYTPIIGLANHGYVTSIPPDKDIQSAKQGIEAAQGWEQCDRCKSRFQVFPGRREEDGSLTSGGSCIYHYGKPYWQERSAVDPKAKRVKRYRCCNEVTGESVGCTKSGSHVFKVTEVKRLATILNFEKTPENLERASDRPVCIDGEMGYTALGLELIRLTATSWPMGTEIFDVLVRPIGEILDLNSRYSGVWPKDMAEALPWSPAPPNEVDGKKKLRIVDSPAAARALLFSHLSPHTPLIGHGLENDLNSTRIIHPIIIDTALLYPHKAGLPYRNSLKALMHTHLNRHIQVIIDGRMDGHDSKEDANAAGDLVNFALKGEWEKMRREGWTLKNGVFEPPAPKEEPSGGHYSNVRGSEPITFLSGSGTRKRLRDETAEDWEVKKEELNY